MTNKAISQRVCRLLLAMPLLILTGCQTIYEGKYEWDAGWRPGTVRSVGSADQVTKTPFRDCRLALSSAEKIALKFAVVSYSFLNRPKNAVVPISPGSTWTAGSPVYINVTNCRTALEPRVVRADPGNKKNELQLKLIEPHG
ncbi:hypothetical protein [Polaromonas sp. AER18D-145]|uniref:hypothetical protein n=1 Tax=Polaromonas sp. AER18D-145 TaxID=1977060 RepID=UPI0011412DD1|nr:hypothetical protein [Polaromonas sp. AER18D-145]